LFVRDPIQHRGLIEPNITCANVSAQETLRRELPSRPRR
jgi:hypothetical protein